MPDPQKQKPTPEQAKALLNDYYIRAKNSGKKIHPEIETIFKQFVSEGIIDPTLRNFQRKPAEDEDPFNPQVTDPYVTEDRAKKKSIPGFFGNLATDIWPTIAGIPQGLAALTGGILSSEIGALQSLDAAKHHAIKGYRQEAKDELDEAKTQALFPIKMLGSFVGAGNGGILDKAAALASLRAAQYGIGGGDDNPETRKKMGQIGDALSAEMLQGILDQSYAHPVQQTLNLATGFFPAGKLAAAGKVGRLEKASVLAKDALDAAKATSDTALIASATKKANAAMQNLQRAKVQQLGFKDLEYNAATFGIPKAISGLDKLLATGKITRAGYNAAKAALTAPLQPMSKSPLSRFVAKAAIADEFSKLQDRANLEQMGGKTTVDALGNNVVDQAYSVKAVDPTAPGTTPPGTTPSGPATPPVNPRAGIVNPMTPGTPSTNPMTANGAPVGPFTGILDADIIKTLPDASLDLIRTQLYNNINLIKKSRLALGGKTLDVKHGFEDALAIINNEKKVRRAAIADAKAKGEPTPVFGNSANLGGSVGESSALIPEPRGEGVTITRGIEDANGNLINAKTETTPSSTATLGGEPLDVSVGRITDEGLRDLLDLTDNQKSMVDDLDNLPTEMLLHSLDQLAKSPVKGEMQGAIVGQLAKRGLGADGMPIAVEPTVPVVPEQQPTPVISGDIASPVATPDAVVTPDPLPVTTQPPDYSSVSDPVTKSMLTNITDESRFSTRELSNHAGWLLSKGGDVSHVAALMREVERRSLLKSQASAVPVDGTDLTHTPTPELTPENVVSREVMQPGLDNIQSDPRFSDFEAIGMDASRHGPKSITLLHKLLKRGAADGRPNLPLEFQIRYSKGKLQIIENADLPAFTPRFDVEASSMAEAMDIIRAEVNKRKAVLAAEAEGKVLQNHFDQQKTLVSELEQGVEQGKLNQFDLDPSIKRPVETPEPALDLSEYSVNTLNEVRQKLVGVAGKEGILAAFDAELAARKAAAATKTLGKATDPTPPVAQPAALVSEIPPVVENPIPTNPPSVRDTNPATSVADDAPMVYRDENGVPLSKKALAQANAPRPTKDLEGIKVPTMLSDESVVVKPMGEKPYSVVRDPSVGIDYHIDADGQIVGGAVSPTEVPVAQPTVASPMQAEIDAMMAGTADGPKPPAVYPNAQIPDDVLRNTAARILHDAAPSQGSLIDSVAALMDGDRAAATKRVGETLDFGADHILFTEKMNKAVETISRRLNLNADDQARLSEAMDDLLYDIVEKHNGKQALTADDISASLRGGHPDAFGQRLPWKGYQDELKRASEGQTAAGATGDGATPGLNGSDPSAPGAPGPDGAGEIPKDPVRAAVAKATNLGGAASFIPIGLMDGVPTAALIAGAGLGLTVLTGAIWKFAKGSFAKFLDNARKDSSAARLYDEYVNRGVDVVLPREDQARVAHQQAMTQWEADRALHEAFNPGVPFPTPEPVLNIPPATAAEINQFRQDLARELATKLELKKTPEGMASADAITDMFMKSVYQIADHFDRIGQEMVDLNLISKEAYDLHKGRHLRRIYEYWENPEAWLDKYEKELIKSGMVKSEIKAAVNQQKAKFEEYTNRVPDGPTTAGNSAVSMTSTKKLGSRKLTDEDAILRQFLGEYDIASVRIRRGGEIMNRELSKARLSNAVAQKFGITYKRAMELRKINDANTHTSNSVPPGTFRNEMEKLYYYEPGLFTQVAESDRLNGLGTYHGNSNTFHGTYIPKQIHEALTKPVVKKNELIAAMEKATGIWKLGATVYNYRAWIGNVLGNSVLGLMGGGMAAFNPANMAKGLQSIKNKDAMWQLAMRHSDHPYDTLRMEVTTKRHLNVDTIYPKDVKTIFENARQKAADGVADAYSTPDVIAKHSLFVNTVEKLMENVPEMDLEKAGQIAATQVDRTFPNFAHGTPIRALRPVVKTLRPAAVPFIAWDASVLPLMARLIMEHPARAGAYTNIYRAYQDAVDDYNAKHGARDGMTGKEAYAEEKRILPDYMKTASIRLPLRGGSAPGDTERGSAPYYLSSNVLNPLNSVTEAESPMGSVIERMNPLISTLIQVYSNKRIGTDIPIYDDAAADNGIIDPVTRAKAGYVISNLIPGGNTVRTAYSLATKTSPYRIKDKDGNPTYDLDDAEFKRKVAAAFRINVQKLDIPNKVRSAVMNLKFEDLPAAKAAIRKALLDEQALKRRELTSKEEDAIIEPIVDKFLKKVEAFTGQPR